MLVLTDESNLSAIGNAIRSVTGVNSTYLPSEMADAVSMLFGADTIAQGLPIHAKGFTSAIVSNAFANIRVSDVEFPNCINIDNSAFMNCKTLVSATFPECKIIGDYAFAGCTALSSVDFATCEYIGSRAFQFCSTLIDVTFPSCTVVNGWAFESCMSLTSISLPECSIISDGTFQYDSKLSNVYLPKCERVNSIAFNRCTALSSITLPVCSIVKQFAFSDCFNLSYISLPECKVVEVSAFEDCHNLQSIDFSKISIANAYAFYNCSSLSCANIPSCQNVNTYAFYSCKTLQSIHLPMGSGHIQPYAFCNCISLSQISTPLCTSIGSYAFWNCPNISAASFPECSYVGSSAFRIVENVTQFFNSLKYAYFPKCTFLGQCAFVCQTGMSYAHFPMLSSVQFATFWGCSGLSDVIFQNCWSIVGHGNYGAFERAGMSVVSLPTCRYIGDRAFMSCFSLTSLYLTGGSYVSLPSQRALWSTPLSLSTYTGDFGSIYVPASMLTDYQSMANWSVYSSRFVGMMLSVGDTVSAFSSYDLISPVGVSMEYQNVEEGKLNLNTFSGGHEGFNIELSNLESGKDYTLEFDLKFIDTQFFSTNQYCVGFMVTADRRTNYTEYTTWPNNITRDNNEHHYTYTFMASSGKMYLSFALDGLSDRNQSMTLTNIIVHESEWVV